jgi:hypothetical protein
MLYYMLYALCYRLLELVVSTNHDYVISIVSSLDYSIDTMSRVIVAKVLKYRIQDTQILLILVCAQVLDIDKKGWWGCTISDK